MDIEPIDARDRRRRDGSGHDSGIWDEPVVAGGADAYLGAGTVVARVTASDPAVVQQLLGRQLDRLP